MKKLLAVFVAVLGFTSVSNAGVLIEPYVGYESGKASGNSGDSTVTGTDYGLRLAYKFPVMFWVGIDAGMGSVTSKPDDGTASTDAKRTMLSAVAGVNFPILFRGWVSYGFSDELKFDSPDAKMKGTSMKVGLGYTIVPFVSLNFEYVTEKFTEMEFGGTTTSVDSSGSGYILSLSVPL